MKIKWKAEPKSKIIHYSIIDENELCKCETISDIKDKIYRIIQIDFDDRISFHILNMDEKYNIGENINDEKI